MGMFDDIFTPQPQSKRMFDDVFNVENQSFVTNPNIDLNNSDIPMVPTNYKSDLPPQIQSFVNAGENYVGGVKQALAEVGRAETAAAQERLKKYEVGELAPDEDIPSTDWQSNAKWQLAEAAIKGPLGNIAITPGVPAPIRAAAGALYTPFLIDDILKSYQKHKNPSTMKPEDFYDEGEEIPEHEKNSQQQPPGVLEAAYKAGKEVLYEPLSDPVKRAINDPKQFAADIWNDPTKLWSDIFLPGAVIAYPAKAAAKKAGSIADAKINEALTPEAVNFAPDFAGLKDTLNEGVKPDPWDLYDSIKKEAPAPKYTVADGVDFAGIKSDTRSRAETAIAEYNALHPDDPITVTDGLRPQNASYGSPTSYHKAGEAFDIVSPGLEKDPAKRATFVEIAQKHGFKEVLDEYTNPSSGATGGHVHIGGLGETVSRKVKEAASVREEVSFRQEAEFISPEVEFVIDEGFKAKPEYKIAKTRAIDEAEALAIKEKTGLDVSGYSHSISAHEVRHALREHSGSAEIARGQIPLVKEDFLQIPEITRPENLISLADGKRGQVLLYEKPVNGHIYLVEEVLVGRKSLRFLTMRKTKRPSARRYAGESDATSNVQNVRSLTSYVDNSIPQEGKLFNGDGQNIRDHKPAAKTEQALNDFNMLKMTQDAIDGHDPSIKALDGVSPEIRTTLFDKVDEILNEAPESEIARVERELAAKVNKDIDPVTPSVGLSLKITNKSPKEESAVKHTFADKETEARWQEASKGVPPEKLRDRVKESVKGFFRKAARTYEHLPNTGEFARLKFDLLQLDKQKAVAGDRTSRLLQGMTLKLDRPGMDLFTRKVILDDLAQTDLSKVRGELPFGLTAESLPKELERINAALESNPAISEVVQNRKAVWDALKTDYTKAMKDIGFDVADKLGRQDYFRHQVLEYANMKAIAGSGQKLKTPTSRGFLKERQGSSKDFNTNYLQAEFEVMAQMLYDTELARTIKAVDKNYNIRGKLIKEFGDSWRDNIPEGYTTWQPREGSAFYLANTIPEKLATQLLENNLTEAGLSKAQIGQVLAKGSPFKEFVVKEEVASTLNEISRPPTNNPIALASKKLTTLWKVWTLMSPNRAIKYNIRNFISDADSLFAINKSAFKEVPKATKELYQTIYGDRAMTSEMGEWFKRGGMESNLSVQELPDINKLRMFEKFGDKDPNFIRNTWNGYWKKVSSATQFREAILRYATYLDYVKQMETNGGKPKNFGASIPGEIMALDNMRDRAFKLSNEAIGAYDSISVMGKDLRAHLIPFWSWTEVNFKRYYQFFQNQKADGALGSAISKKLVGGALIRSPYYAYALGSFTIKSGAFWAMLQAYNNLVFPEEERELPIEEQARPHIVLGRNDDGTVKYFSRVGAFSDFLEWFGLGTPVKDAKDYLDGTRSLPEIARDMAKSPIDKSIQGVTPLIKTPAELLTGKKTFPDVLNPGTIRDKPQYLADSLGLGAEFRAISKTTLGEGLGMKPRPSKPYFSQDRAENLFYYKAVPNQTAYYGIQERKQDFLKSAGKSGEGDFSNAKTEALRNYKLAIRLKDEQSAAYYLQEYKDLGGKKQTLKKSFEAMHPLAGLSRQDQVKFKKSLSAEQQKELEKAITYYKTVLTGK